MIEQWRITAQADLLRSNFTVGAANPLFLNVSRGMLNSVVASLDVLKAANETLDHDGGRHGSDLKRATAAFSAFVIANESGKSVKYAVVAGQAGGGAERKEEQFELEGGGPKQAALPLTLGTSNGRVKLMVAGYDPLEVDPQRISSTTLSPTLEAADAKVGKADPPLVVSVELKNGSRVLTIRPPLSLRNMTGAKVELLGGGDGGKNKALLPGTSIWLPHASLPSDIAFQILSGGTHSPQPRCQIAGEQKGAAAAVVRMGGDGGEGKDKKSSWQKLLSMGRKDTAGDDSDGEDNPPSLMIGEGAKDGDFQCVYTEIVREDANKWAVVVSSPLILSNYLPCAATFRITTKLPSSSSSSLMVRVEPAGVYHCLKAHPDSLSVEVKLPWMKDWSEACDLTGKGGGARVESVVAEDKGRSGDKRTPFKLNIEVDREAGSGSILAAFYAPVWIYNACTEPKLKLGVAAADSSIPFPPLELKEGEGGKVVVGKDSKNDTAAVVSGGGDGKKVGKGEAAAAMGEGKGVPKSNGGNTNPPAFMVGAGVEKVKVRFESDEAEGRAGFGTWSSSLVDLSVAGQSDVLQVISPTPSADSRRAKAAREVERRMMIKASRNSCGACAACRKPVNPIQQSAYSIGWQMSLAPAPFDRTLVLTMAPRFFIRNELPAKIAIRQALDGIPLLPEKPQKLGGGDSSIVHVEPGTHVAYHWSHAFLEQFVRFRLEAEAPLPRGRKLAGEGGGGGGRACACVCCEGGCCGYRFE
eukprot:jgi/Bigna1/137500/aug1.39_g12208